MKPFFKSVRMLLLICLSTLLLAELSVRLFFLVTDEAIIHADKATKNEWQWVKKHLANKPGSVPNATKSHQYDADVGWLNKANIVSDKKSTNSMGMRTQQEFSYQPEVGRKRMVVLGASYVNGAFVNNKEMFTAVLAKQYLPQWDVINLAVGGTGTDQQLLIYEKFGRRYQPDIVVMGFHVRNYFRNVLSFTDYAKPKFVIEDDRLQLTNMPVIAPRDLYAQYQSGQRRLGQWYDSQLYHVIAKLLNKAKRRKINAQAEGWLVLEKIMQRFQIEVQKTGAIPIWMILSSRDVLEKPRSRYDALEVLSEQRCQQLKMLCLRVSPYFVEYNKANPTGSFYRPREVGGHYSATGHSLVAKLIFELLSQHNLLELKPVKFKS